MMVRMAFRSSSFKAGQALVKTARTGSCVARVSRQYVSLLELNEKSPSVDVLIRLCRAMGASAGEILARVEKAQ